MMLTLTMFERAFDMFDYLRGRYIEKATDRPAELLSNLYSTKMSNSESLQSHLETMLLYRKQLQLGQTEFTDQMFMQGLYKSLAPKFLDYKNSLRARHLTLQEVISALTAYDDECEKYIIEWSWKLVAMGAESQVSMMTSLKDNSGLYIHEQTPQMRRRHLLKLPTRTPLLPDIRDIPTT
ncbi:hypothetical protein LIPSTDRAFT_198882 [Lipomyces starkeyi NRRL Y-11557]|uniref:Uncharacterized protein n=1 Tax=Lipomyces starkeyi NRRL Y-11557 TaxID=675824 RepID=A0A1E3PVQ0_LIPST|nr:hypothetical protein LIPSTDRAFT_198882 [Lipomyces starkeyi NRRL Y-11557]